MAEPYLAEIRIFGFNFAPSGWAQCNGQILGISQNTALFSLLGTTYGGDGKSTFALPDLGGRAALHPGQGPGLSLYVLGEIGGSDTVQLSLAEMPNHAHTLMASSQQASQYGPDPTRVLAPSAKGVGYQTNTTGNLTQMNDAALGNAGSGFPHNNRQPSLVLNFCIALQGAFPPRPPEPREALPAG